MSSDQGYKENKLRQEGPAQAFKAEAARAKKTVGGSGGTAGGGGDGTASKAAAQSFLLLRATFTVLPILFGIDKFFDFMVNWEMYLAPWIENLVPVDAATFMVGVGVIEIVGGLLVAVAPRIGAPIVALWLLLIVVNLATYNPPQYYDIALRDVGLMLGALTLTRLAFGVSGSR